MLVKGDLWQTFAIIKYMNNRGFIRNIIIIVAALVALKYFFHFDLVGLITQGKYKEVVLWLKENIWQKFIVDIVWTHMSGLFKKW